MDDPHGITKCGRKQLHIWIQERVHKRPYLQIGIEDHQNHLHLSVVKKYQTENPFKQYFSYFEDHNGANQSFKKSILPKN